MADDDPLNQVDWGAVATQVRNQPVRPLPTLEEMGELDPRRLRWALKKSKDPRHKVWTRRRRGAGARMKTLQEYNRHFQTAKKVVGHGTTTTSDELEKGMRKLGLRPMAVGTVCDPKDKTYMIVNESCELPGTHWVAYYKGARYDPLGKDRSKSAEQKDSETNCGQRCLAYLLMCRAHKNYVNL